MVAGLGGLGLGGLGLGGLCLEGFCFDAGLGLLWVAGGCCWESFTGLEHVLRACLSAVDLIIASSFFFLTKAMMLICLMAEADADEQEEGEAEGGEDEGAVAVGEVFLEDSAAAAVAGAALWFCWTQDSLAFGVDSVAAFLLLGALCFGVWLLI